MRLWPILALVAIVLSAYAFFYVLGSLSGQGSTPFGLVNTVGLLAVIIGVAAAFVILRRAKPQ